MQDDPFADENIIDIRPPRKRRTWLIVTVVIVIAVLLFGSQAISIYIDSLWFSSLDYSDVYWYKFRVGGLLFLIFFILTFLIIRLPFLWINRVLPELTERPQVKITSIEDIREVNFLPFIYRPGVWVLSAGVALLSAISMSSAWSKFALYLNGQDGTASDPVFGNNIGFYLFKLPVYEAVAGWFMTLSVILLLTVGGASGYIYYLERLRGTATADTRRRVTSAISAAAALFALALALSTFLNRYDLLYSRHALFTGMNYTDANVRLIALNIIIGLLLLTAVALLANAFSLRQPRIIFYLAGAVIGVWIVGVALLPQAIQSFSVKPNELAKESPYISHNIQMTRHAFGIDQFQEIPVPTVELLSVEDLRANQDTLDNVRLWDRRALQATLSQIQEIRTYYEFNVPDVDRYMLNGKLRQVFLAAREMNTEQLPQQSRNWINQHLVYTHGYGVTMNTVNEFTPEGQPHLLLKNMPVEVDPEAPEIKITRPEIYFGERTNEHVYVGTKSQGATPPEFDFPAPDNTESYTTYQGKAGIEVGGLFRQLALSVYLGDGTSLLLSDYITSESRVLIHRNIRDRVQRIAPYILFDDDPYIVISREGKLFWMIDGFTTSDRYPYSSSYSIGREEVNYIRNSVKAVVDAYDGAVQFYVFDNVNDPVIKAYQSIFPSLYRPASEMPQDLFEHIRYPSLLVALQAEVYKLYHMQSAQTFYNREDLWEIATGEPQAEGANPQPMTPYHVLMQLSLAERPPLEFVSVLPFTPTGPGRSNMIGWMAARSDGAFYGNTVVFGFPKNLTINGPAQVRARINQDAELSQLITLWSRAGSEILRGSLFVIPIADTLIYVESFFLQAQGAGSKLPELRQVVLATQDKLVAGSRFDEALNKLIASLGQPPPASQQQQPTQVAEAQTQQQPPPSQPQAQPLSGDAAQLAQQAQRLLTEYEQLTAQGRYREAGERLEQLKQTLAELNRRRGG